MIVTLPSRTWGIKLDKQDDGAVWTGPKDCENWTMLLYVSVNSIESKYVEKQNYVKIKLTPCTPSPSRPPTLALPNKQKLMLVSFTELV